MSMGIATQKSHLIWEERSAKLNLRGPFAAGLG